MAFDDFQAKQRLNKQKAVVRDFFAKRSGQALCLSDDQTFINLLRAAIKEMSLSMPGLLAVVSEPGRLLKVIADSFAEDKKPVLFIERILNPVGDTGVFIKQMKDAYPELKIIVLTTTADKERVMLMHEHGADDFILKPISGNELVEKMGGALREPGLLTQLLNKARTFVVRNAGGEAMKITQAVLQKKPDNPTGYVIMGDALKISGHRDKAQLAYERASKYSDVYLEPLQRLLELAKEEGKKDQQLEYLKRLDTISPLNTQRKVEMGELLVSMGNPEAATQLFDTAVSRVYKDAMAQVAAMTEKIAVSLQDTDPVQAERYLRQTLELKGKDLTIDDLSTFVQLGISLRKQGRWEDAIIEYKRALKIAPNAEGLFYNMGMAYAEGKDYEAAIKHMQKALSLNPDMPRSSVTLAYNMGMVFAYGYTTEKALQCFKTALELDPSYTPAKKALDRLKAQEETAAAAGE